MHDTLIFMSEKLIGNNNEMEIDSQGNNYDRHSADTFAEIAHGLPNNGVNFVGFQNEPSGTQSSNSFGPGFEPPFASGKAASKHRAGSDIQIVSSPLIHAGVEANGDDRLPRQYAAPLHDDDFQCKITQVGVDVQDTDDLIDNADQAEDLVMEEARRAWELGKSLGLSSPNEIDVFWAMAKDRKSKKR